MNLFSQRRGITPVRVELQRNSIDLPLRNKLWSAIQVILFDNSAEYLRRKGTRMDRVMARVWLYYFKRPIDTLPGTIERFRVVLRGWFFDEAAWHDVYDFLEVLHGELSDDIAQNLTELVNNFLEEEMSAFRFVSGQIAEITSAEEVAAIEAAINDPSALTGVRTHLQDALAKMTDRDTPDYRNSIKESISAVEALCQKITGDERATLGQALKKLSENGVSLHPALEQAWSKLYGYTNDASGIRHALSEESTVTFGDAKYMLVSCSAFINHLTELAANAGLSLS